MRLLEASRQKLLNRGSMSVLVHEAGTIPGLRYRLLIFQACLVTLKNLLTGNARLSWRILGEQSIGIKSITCHLMGAPKLFLSRHRKRYISEQILQWDCLPCISLSNLESDASKYQGLIKDQIELSPSF